MRDYSELRRRVIEELKSQGILNDPNVVRAMKKVPREEFLPPEARSYAYVDSPIPIGFGQTTSALHMTALLCEYGQMKLGQQVLEVGGGCGYMSCVYAEVVAPEEETEKNWGHVWSAEVVPELAEFGKQNVERLGYGKRVTVIAADASDGLEGAGPFDLIIVTSAAPEVPDGLVMQLKDSGNLLIPVGTLELYQELLRIRKTPGGKTRTENLGGVAFVPMRGKRGWTR